MRIIANENVPGDAVEALRRSGHDVLWVRTEMPGSCDTSILARAQSERRLVVTFDKGFGELAFRAHLPASTGIVLFRISMPSSAAVSAVVVAAPEDESIHEGHPAAEEPRLELGGDLGVRRGQHQCLRGDPRAVDGCGQGRVPHDLDDCGRMAMEA